MSTSPCKIITFYSYKGGVGRSMILANAAWILASNAKRVLVIDWDLEAPGLHRYFRPFLPDKDLKDTEGLIDFFENYVNEALTPSENSDESWYEPFADILYYTTSVDWPFQKGGTIHLVPAGRQDTSYATRVNLFNWQNFYERFSGGEFIEIVKKNMRSEYDYVLIDSRTGVSDTSGICTIQMPDILVTFFSPNNQSINGAAGIARSVHDQWNLADNETMVKRLIYPVLTRTDRSEKEKLNIARDYVRKKFEPFLYHIPKEETDDYWMNTEVSYFPWYAYEEILAVFGDDPKKERALLNSAENIVSYLTKKDVYKVNRPPSKKEREEIFSQFFMQSLEPPPKLASMAKKHTFDGINVFISYSRKDAEWRDRIVSHLEAISDPDMKVWHDSRIGPGEEWYPEIEIALNTADACILVVSRNFLTSKFIREEEIPRILDRKEKDGLIVVPVIAEPCGWKKVPWLSQMAFRPKTGKPLSGGNGHQTDAELASITEELCDLLPKLKTQMPSKKNRSCYFVRIRKSFDLESVADKFIKEYRMSGENDQLDIGQYLYNQISRILRQNTPDKNEADIRIISPDERIAALPWHLMAKDNVFLTRWAVSLSTQEYVTDYMMPSAPKVLIIAPQPVGMEKTDAESHLENLENHLSEKNHHFSLGMGIEVAYTWEEYIRKLERSDPQIIYFYGHCKNDPDNPRLCFATGKKHELIPVSPAEFADSLEKMVAPPALIYVNCPDHIAGLIDLGMILGDAVPALILSRNLTSPEIAQAQALLLLEDILTQGIAPHRSVASLYGRLDDRLNISTADARWMTPAIFTHYDHWNARKSEPLSRRIHDPYWHLKIDRVSQFSAVATQTLQMLQERRPKSLAFVWYGTEGQGIEKFHHRLSVELKNYLIQFNTFPCEVRPEWPAELDRPKIAFQDCLAEAFGVSELEDIPMAIRHMNLGISGKQTLVYVRHQPVTSPLLINPKSLKAYLEWWDSEFIPLLEKDQFALLGVSFIVKNPVKFQISIIKISEMVELSLDNTVFRLLDEMEQITKKDLLDFLRTHSIYLPVRHRDKIIERILEKTGGHYEKTVQELRLLVAQSWELNEGNEMESKYDDDDYDY